MPKKYEILNGTVFEVEKRLQGRTDLNVLDVRFYAEDQVPKVIVLGTTEEGGKWSFAPTWGFKEWTLEEWQAQKFYGIPLDENWDPMPVSEIYEPIGDPLYYLNPKEGVSVVQFHAYFNLGAEFGKVKFTMDGDEAPQGNGGLATKTVVLSGMENWPEEGPYNVSVGNGGGYVEFTGTLSELKEHVFDFSDSEPTSFMYYANGSIESDQIRTYFNWYEYGWEGEWPITVESDDAVQIKAEYISPAGDEGGLD